MPNADVILQSSDLVHFRVNKLVLITSSPFFSDMFSLPQPLNDTTLDGLPVVHLSEDAEVLDSLFSMLYPVTPEMPHSCDGILALLAAATKYDMDAIQTLIRAEISRRGVFSSAGAGIFRVYAVACSKGLVPEVVTTARLTLGYPLTFESLGDALQLFEGWALRDLANFRLRSIRNFSSNWRLFSNCLRGPSKIWVGCATNGEDDVLRLPTWLQDCLWWKMADRFGPIRMDRFTETIPTCVQLCDKYLKALRTHVKEDDCHFCMKTHILQGENFCKEMKDISAKAWNVPTLMSRELGERPGTPSSYVETDSS
jgi:BTB/POZ domain